MTTLCSNCHDHPKHISISLCLICLRASKCAKCKIKPVRIEGYELCDACFEYAQKHNLCNGCATRSKYRHCDRCCVCLGIAAEPNPLLNRESVWTTQTSLTTITSYTATTTDIVINPPKPTADPRSWRKPKCTLCGIYKPMRKQEICSDCYYKSECKSYIV